MTHELTSPSSKPATWTSWGISLLNGLVGDYLAGRNNGLAIKMAFYDQNRALAPAALALYSAPLSRTHPHANGKVAILVHGLGCNESVWAYRDPAPPGMLTSYGAQLQADLGFTPFYLRYNTGLPVAENGKRLAGLLAELLDNYPRAVEEIVLIGHSMGGLVLRSACFYAAQGQASWVEQVTQVFYLGSPHDGAYLEKVGHVATRTLQTIPHPVTRLVGDIFDLRSQGIKDLREGALVADGDAHFDPVLLAEDGDVPWLPRAHHHVINGILVADAQHPLGALLGDGLVPLPKGRRPEAGAQDGLHRGGRSLHLVPKMHHLQLAHDPAIYQRIKQSCSAL